MEQGKVTTVEVTPRLYEIKVEGSFDSSNLERLEGAILGLLDRGINKIVLNLADATYLSSSGFSILIRLSDVAIQSGGRLTLAGTPMPILDIFTILGLKDCFIFAQDRDRAVNSLIRA